jgi:hypothetical protein
VRVDRSTVHTWNLGMPLEAEPYTLVQVTRSTRVQVSRGGDFSSGSIALIRRPLAMAPYSANQLAS